MTGQGGAAGRREDATSQLPAAPAPAGHPPRGAADARPALRVERPEARLGRDGWRRAGELEPAVLAELPQRAAALVDGLARRRGVGWRRGGNPGGGGFIAIFVPQYFNGVRGRVAGGTGRRARAACLARSPRRLLAQRESRAAPPRVAAREARLAALRQPHAGRRRRRRPLLRAVRAAARAGPAATAGAAAPAPRAPATRSSATSAAAAAGQACLPSPALAMLAVFCAAPKPPTGAQRPGGAAGRGWRWGSWPPRRKGTESAGVSMAERASWRSKNTLAGQAGAKPRDASTRKGLAALPPARDAPRGTGRAAAMRDGPRSLQERAQRVRQRVARARRRAPPRSSAGQDGPARAGR
jgi:hypothetical protein